MINFLLDTSAYISLTQAAPGAVFSAISEDGTVGVSVVTEIELRFGVAASVGRADHRLRRRQLEVLLSTYRPIPVDSVVASVFEDVAAAAIARGQQPRRRMNDLMIAATALTHHATLLTDDADLRTALVGLVPTRSLA